MSGINENGFVRKTQAEIRAEIEDAFRAQFGNSINLQAGSVFGTIIGIQAEREGEIWELAESIYNAGFVDTATGTNLDNVVGYTGIARLAARATTIENVLLFGDAGTTIPAGTQFSVESNPDSVFETDFDVTLVAGVNEEQTIAFSATPDAGSFTLQYRNEVTAAIPHSANAAAVASALNALTILSGVTVTGSFAADFVVEFDGNDGLQNQPLLIAVSSLVNGVTAVDITVTESTTGEPQGSVSVTATNTGPIAAPYGTLNVIDTPVSGLNRVFNPDDEILGRNRETDSELRTRRVISLQAAGLGTVEAIRARLLNVDGVLNAFVFENDTLTTDIDGRPGKSFEAVVSGGVNQDIADTIWTSKPAGIEAFGDITETVIDSLGVARSVSFSRPTPVPIYVSIDLDTDSDFPDNGAALAQAAIVAWGNSLGIGQDVIVYPRLVSQLNSIPGILDMTIRIDDAPVSITPGDPAEDDNISIGPTQVAEFSETNTDINLV